MLCRGKIDPVGSKYFFFSCFQIFNHVKERGISFSADADAIRGDASFILPLLLLCSWGFSFIIPYIIYVYHNLENRTVKEKHVSYGRAAAERQTGKY